MVTYGLAPFFRSTLIDKIKSQGPKSPYVMLFDESLNKKTQGKQLDIMVRFWDNEANKVVSRYWTSDFLGHATSDDLFQSIKSNIRPLPLCDMLQMSMDGPNVNWKLHALMQDFLKDEHNVSLINIGSCGLHIIHGAFNTGSMQQVGESMIV